MLLSLEAAALPFAVIVFVVLALLIWLLTSLALPINGSARTSPKPSTRITSLISTALIPQDEVAAVFTSSLCSVPEYVYVSQPGVNAPLPPLTSVESFILTLLCPESTPFQ